MHDDESFARNDHQSTIAQEEVMLLDDLPGMAADATFSAEDDLLLPRTLTIFPRRIDSGTAFTDDQQSKGGAAPHELGQASPEHILELVDCALRLAICEKPLKLPSGIKITRDNVTRLATVAPALWRPHHLKAVSERAPFLPAIAHTLSHSLLVNARSAPLKRKTAELLGRYPPAVTRTGPLSPGDARQYRDPKLVYEAASIELWHLLQRNSFDSGANWRLKPLKTRPQDIGVRDPGESDEMLYENISHFHPGLNHFADADYSIDSPYSFQDREPEEMLWELNKEPDESEMDSTYTIPPTPSEKRMARKISRSSSTDQTMLLDWDNAVKFGHNHVSGNVLEAQGPPATSNPKVAVPFDDVDGEVSLFEVTGQIETIIPVDVYDRLPADPEMLFD
ncbi:hypothetical protein GTA08_BOTSDO01088 [Botryosphaeria dothidea]|uniref:Uncharacterized protein n=1 Tax=Botryosphaeria dothidea TaxID=55169 RepID=A0A8H4NBQ9_9PEZI|nr:hypothetical protein GTA08_BOTSDO01088 [Botryosphaeria dothidea]